MELAEVYRVIYEGPDVILRGTIVCKDEEKGCQDLYNDQGLDDDNTFKGYSEQSNLRNKPLIRNLDHIIPNGPTKASIRATNGFSVNFDLFGVISEELTFKYPYGRPDKCSAPLTEDILSRDGARYLTVLYAIFENAVEAHVKVTLTNNSDPFDLYGVIAARTSAIVHRAYSSLIFLKGHGEKIKIGDEDDIIIPLSRHIVAVPLGSQLILEFSLNVSDTDKMVETIVTFDAKKGGTSTTSISCKKGVFKVEVKWTSMRKPEKVKHKPTK